MKIKATKKELKNGFYHIIHIGYCNAEALLHYCSPFSYCAGTYGWACDNYEIEGVLISTGYNPLNDKNAKSDYNKTMEYNKKARSILSNYDIDRQEQKVMIEALLKQYIGECIA